MQLDASSPSSAAKAMLDLITSKRHGAAPRAILDSAASLLCGTDPDAVFADAQTEDDSVVWRVAMLRGNLLIWIEASKKGNVWSSESGFHGGDDPDSLDAWARPVSRVRQIRVRRVVRHDDDFAKTWNWDTEFEIEMDDSMLLALPWRAAAQGEPFVAELAQRLARVER